MEDINPARIHEFSEFLQEANSERYKFSGRENDDSGGFRYTRGLWLYETNIPNYFLSSVQKEKVYCDEKPFWEQYSEIETSNLLCLDLNLVFEIVDFHRHALKEGKKLEKESGQFQPRGPAELKDERHEKIYFCIWGGDITNFNGKESIIHDTDNVLDGRFKGGLIS